MAAEEKKQLYFGDKFWGLDIALLEEVTTPEKQEIMVIQENNKVST